MCMCLNIYVIFSSFPVVESKKYNPAQVYGAQLIGRKPSEERKRVVLKPKVRPDILHPVSILENELYLYTLISVWCFKSLLYLE